jgi:hypothetical protein
MEISQPMMAEVLRQSPECLQQLSELLARRKMETEGILKDAAIPADQEKKAQEYTDSFLQRLRSIFVVAAAVSGGRVTVDLAAVAAAVPPALSILFPSLSRPPSTKRRTDGLILFTEPRWSRFSLVSQAIPIKEKEPLRLTRTALDVGGPCVAVAHYVVAKARVPAPMLFRG